jgi:DivIVA domain-containing protein
VALDRSSIEKRDFPVTRRGYDPESVDAHLSEIAAEVERLGQSVRSGSESLAGAASAQVRSIVEAAEATAAQIRADAEQQAGRILRQAETDARTAQTSAAARASERVDQVSKAAVGMLERIEAIDQELGALLEALRAGATRLNAELAQLQDSLHEAGEPASRAVETQPAADAASTPEPVSEPEALSEPEPEAEPQPEPEPPPIPPPAPAANRIAPRSGTGAKTGSDEEGARLIALNMALNGSSRGEVDRYLRENYELTDQGALVDDVFASFEG